jgi:hypothetical protein
LTVVAVAGIALLALAIRPVTARGQAQAATVAVEVASKTGTTVQLNVGVRNASNLAGFQFVLSYDSNLLAAQDVTKTEFLTMSGRQLACQDPVIETGAVRYTCVTLGLLPPGVDGDGTLAVVTFKTSNSGTSPLALSKVILVHPDGTELPSTSVDGTLTIGGSSGFPLWLRIVIGIAAAAVIAGLVALTIWRRRRSASSAASSGSLGNDPV